MLFVFHHFSQMSVTYDWLNFGSEVITRPVTVAGTDSRGWRAHSDWLLSNVCTGQCLYTSQPSKMYLGIQTENPSWGGRAGSHPLTSHSQLGTSDSGRRISQKYLEELVKIFEA